MGIHHAQAGAAAVEQVQQELAQAQGTVQQLREELLAMQVAASQQATAQVLPPCADLIASGGLACPMAGVRC